MYIFVLCLRNLIKLQGKVWAWLCTASGSASGSQDGWTACSSSWSSGPWALLIKAMTLRLRSRGNVPSSILGGAPLPPKPTSLVLVTLGVASPEAGRTQGGLRGHLVLAGRLRARATD